MTIYRHHHHHHLQDFCTNANTYLDVPFPLSFLHFSWKFFNWLSYNSIFHSLFLFIGDLVWVVFFLLTREWQKETLQLHLYSPTLRAGAPRKWQYSPNICSSVSSLSRGQAYHAVSVKQHRVYTGSVVGQIYWGCGTPTHTEDLQTCNNGFKSWISI